MHQYILHVWESSWARLVLPSDLARKSCRLVTFNQLPLLQNPPVVLPIDLSSRCSAFVLSSRQVPETMLFHRHAVCRMSAPRSLLVSCKRWITIHNPSDCFVLAPLTCAFSFLQENSCGSQECSFFWIADSLSFCDVKEPLISRTSTIHHKNRDATVSTGWLKKCAYFPQPFLIFE